MISVEKLNEHLIGDFDAVISLLEELGIFDINPNYSKREIRCSRDEGRNPSSVRIKIDTLGFRCFSTGEKGNLYTMIMSRLDKSFPETLRWVAKTLKIDDDLSLQPQKLPFNGFFKKILRQTIEPELELKKYDEDILTEYRDKYSLLFNRDGIGYDTQRYFDVGYDEYSDRITIPQWDVNGKLVGVMGRLNEIDAPTEIRWLPIIPCQRSMTLFGYHQNYHYIQKKDFVLIGESEKFVMQLHSMGIRNSLAVCGCDISSIQAKYIKALMCKRIIICFDEGLEEDSIITQAKKVVVDNHFAKNKVGYVYDSEGELMFRGSKCSPSDRGLEILKKIINTKVKWL